MSKQAPTALASALTLVLLVCPGPGRTHDELPSEQWCATGTAVEVAVFNFRPATLLAVREQCQSGPTGSPRDCGHFDDDYDVGFQTARAHCSQFATSGNNQSDIGTTISLVSSPATFLHRDHHDLYELTHGLEGSCVRCELPVAPVGPLSPRR